MLDKPDRATRRTRLVVSVTVTVAIVVALTAGGVFVWKYVAAPPSTDSQTKTYDKQISRLEFTGETGRIEVVESTGTETVVESSLQWTGDNKPDSSQDLSAETLSIKESGCTESTMGGNCQVEFRIAIPADVELDVMVESGTVESDGIQGDQRLEVIAGDIKVADATANLDLKSESGIIDGRNLESSEVSASLESGSVDLNFASAPSSVNATGQSGPVTVEVPEDGKGYAVDVSTDMNEDSVEVAHDASSEREITVKTDSGPVTVDYA